MGNIFHCRIDVSIPYLSGHPFLHKTPRVDGGAHLTTCQSPIYRDTHFYSEGKWEATKDPVPVSIPYLSGHPFLQKMTAITITNFMCQSPIYRDTHFYIGGTPLATIIGRIVSIPYLSGHPFLRYPQICKRHRIRICVNPLSIGTPISTDLNLLHML